MKKYRLQNLIKDQHKRELKIPGNYCQPDLLWTSNYLISYLRHRIISYTTQNNKNVFRHYKTSFHIFSNQIVCGCVCVHACVRVCVRACVRAWVCVLSGFYTAVLLACSIMLLWLVEPVWLWQTRLSLWQQPWQEHKDTHVCHTAKKPWQQYLDWSRKHFDPAAMENVRLQRKQASMNPQEMGQRNYSAMVDLIEAGLWSNDNQLHGGDSVCDCACVCVQACTSVCTQL